MIYVLFLEQNKWYVGFTEREIGIRIAEHFDSNGSEWTKKYKPIQLMHIQEGTPTDEDNLTLKYMLEYGWWNVRGGRWCQINMTMPPIELLPNLSTDITREVYLHNVSENLGLVPKNITLESLRDDLVDSSHNDSVDSSHNELPDTSNNINITQMTTKLVPTKMYKLGVIVDKYEPSIRITPNHHIPTKMMECYRCGRDGHFMKQCYAKSHINGKNLN